MKNRIVMIGTDGMEVKTREEADIASGSDRHDKLFMEDIFSTTWFQNQNIAYHPERPFQSQLPELTSTGDIVMLDTSYEDRFGNIHNGIQIVAPEIDKITDAQKEVLADYYHVFKDQELSQVMIDCVEDIANFEMKSFYDVDSFYEAVGIKVNELGRAR